MAKGGLLELGGEEVSGKGFGWFWGTTDQDVPTSCLSFTGIGEGVGMMHMETEGKHLVMITSELGGVGEISSPG